MGLGDKKCIPCRGGIPPLPRPEAEKLALETPKWRLNEAGDRLSREFAFRDFKSAMKFVNRVADLAEEEGHHPDFVIHYSKVELVLFTHKIGGLHENDFILAAKIDGLGGVTRG
jgi:4a-hydroxytetrahydrobiopterin dehydratase